MRDYSTERYHVVFWAMDSQDHYHNLIAATVSEMPKYRRHLRFLFLKDPNEKARKTWRIEKLPMIVGFTEMNFESGSHKTLEFLEQMVYENVLDFLDMVFDCVELLVGVS